MWLIPWALAICVVNPFREIAKDDDWAYALTVKRLLDSHEYRLHDWATANLPAQVLIGGAFSEVFGFSFTALRLSTLTVLAVALAGLWRSLKSRGLTASDAGTLTMVVASSPLVFLFGLSFMTDAPFLAWTALTLVTSIRALETRGWKPMFLASVFAALAILTRQFGVVLPAALSGALLVARADGRLWLAGLALPAIAAGFQVWSGLHSPTAFMQVNLAREGVFLGDFAALPGEALRRFSRIAQYVGLFSLPLFPVLAHLATRRRTRTFGAWVVLVAALAISDLATGGASMPSLNGNLSAALSRLPLLRLPLTLAATFAAALLGVLFTRDQEDDRRSASPTSLRLGLTAFLLTLVHVAYVDLLDEYLIPFLPLVVLAVAREFGRAPRALKTATASLSLASLALSAVWTFALFERKEAFWRAADVLRQQGIPAERIYAGEWTYYHLGEGARDLREFSAARIATSTHLVWDPLFAPYHVDENWILLFEEFYRWPDFSRRAVGVYRRIDPPGDEASRDRPEALGIVPPPNAQFP